MILDFLILRIQLLIAEVAFRNRAARLFGSQLETKRSGWIDSSDAKEGISPGAARARESEQQRSQPGPSSVAQAAFHDGYHDRAYTVETRHGV